ncbi:hypothetical protein [Sporosarcina sp. HYO08]|uniref:hypothetical protein n=1 Tax=Sporosarcina sp. HYO08 TaxID=1759557 RepID=UPI0007982F36|nr:hypothetical protein [Sporosarcina sp. HYO08]KXH87040.1 hypothetical protein AU377_00210 [Sporosarcina sp. HYO08]
MNYTVIERCDKETEETLQPVTEQFLQKEVGYLKQKQKEFLYVESPDFNNIRVDAVVLECDDVFQTITALFGFKAQKKHRDAITTYLQENLNGAFSALFSGDEGLWEVNITLDGMDSFNEESSLADALQLVHSFVAQLADVVEAA